jgi:hypothetical protein
MTADRARHRAPPPPPLLARLNESSPLRVALTAGAGLLILGSLIGIADDMGDDFTPRARAAVVALPTRAEEPTGRGGPLAPVFDDVDAPDYPIGDGLPVSTPHGRGVVVTQRPVIATKSSVPGAPPVVGVSGSAERDPVSSQSETPATTPPAEPEPVVGLPVVESAEPAPPAPTEEEAPVTETEPTVVVEPTATPEPTPIEETP